MARNTNDNEPRIAELTEEIEHLEKQIELLKHQLNQTSNSEKSPPRKSRAKTVYLFNEAEQEQNHKAPEPTQDVLTKYASKKDSSNIPVKEIDLNLRAEERFCPRCGTAFVETRKGTPHQELDLIPDDYALVEYILYSYHCPRCKDGASFSTHAAPTLMKQSIVSAYTVADVMVRKYADWKSLDKQHKRLAKDGIDVSTATLANWIIRCTDNWLKPLYRHMKQELLTQSVIHVDHTPIRTVSPSPSDTHIYSYVSGNRCTPIVLLDLSGKTPDAFLKGFTGCLVSNCNPEYTKIQTATHCACWLHMNHLLQLALAEGPDSTDNPALNGLRLCSKLLNYEQKCSRMTSAARKDYRRNISVSTLEEFFLWIKHVKAEPGTKLAEATSYAMAHETELSAFLDHGDASTVNALALQALEPFSTGKKVWQFSDTQKNAQSSILVYSLIRTAIANGLSPFDYFCYILVKRPRLSKTPSKEELSALMPWS